jgi:phage-related protein
MREKPLFWIGSTLGDLRRFPREVQREMGFALYRAQLGGRHVNAKPLRGFGGAGVLEIVEDYRGDTFRAVYTVKFAEVVYAIHAFQKKAKRGRKTPRREIDLIRERLRHAREHYDRWRQDR